MNKKKLLIYILSGVVCGLVFLILISYIRTGYGLKLFKSQKVSVEEYLQFRDWCISKDKTIPQVIYISRPPSHFETVTVSITE